MDTLRLKNYRCFDDTKEIAIKPLTLLLGSNSSGKSSFLKFFPLVKQSVGLRRNGSFLWMANDVDFKDFGNTVKDGKGNIIIEFTFQNFSVRSHYPFDEEQKEQGSSIHVKVVIAPKDKDGSYDYVKEIQIEFYDQNIKISIKKSGRGIVEVNDLKVDEGYQDCLVIPGADLLPEVLYSNGNNSNGWIRSNVWARNKILEIIGKEKCLFSEFRYEDFRYPNLMPRADFIALVKKQHKRLNAEQLNKLNDFYIFFHVNSIMDGINDGITSLCYNMTYVKPLRATTERYYRYQNYAIDEIDSDGKNLAMYLANLSETNRNSFSEWLQELFGFRLEVRQTEGHVVIDVIEKGKPKRNLVDVGFGYTQILPVVAIIWKALNVDSNRSFHSWLFDTKQYLVVIEQPELHLHPRMQGKFAEMLLRVLLSAKNKNRDLRFVIETHSEVIINKIGELIATELKDSLISAEDTNIVLFNVKGTNKGYVETTSYNSDGSLKYWPLGFLSSYAD